MIRKFLPLFTFLVLSATTYGQNRIGTGVVQSLYEDSCASCHGERLQGGLAQSLLDETWRLGSDDVDLFNVIKNGAVDLGMPAFSESLSDEQVRSLVVFIRENKNIYLVEHSPQNAETSEGVFQTKLHSFRLETVHRQKGLFWSLDFMPDGSIIATEKDGELYLLKETESGALATQIKGIPDVWQQGQGGLLEVALHPDYVNNQWVYLSFSAHDGNNERAGITKVVRGKINGNQWVEEQTIFDVPSEYHSGSRVHFGSRFAFQDGYLYFSIGDRGLQDQAQDVTRPNGKIHRIHDDGRIPEDNPFVDVKGAYKSIWTYGNRNPQGLDVHPATGVLWQTEHGPRGGDEVNFLEKGKNYGWPLITQGINYDGTPITGQTHREGMEQPAHYWVPSIAVCGIDFYEGNRFPEWENNLLVTGLASEELRRLVISGDEIIEDEIILKGQGRIRDVVSGPDGLVYVILNSRAAGTTSIQRLIPL